MFSQVIDAVDKVGVTFVVAIGLAWVVKWLFQAHLKALNSRIDTLEKVIAKRDEQIEAMNQERLETTQDFGRKAEVLARTVADEMRESRRERQAHRVVLARLIDTITVRPCMQEPAAPPRPPRALEVRRPPSSDELPPAPSDAPTDRIMQHG
jgi:uncharacterized coiled-coil protein SlyX